jgi:hypothetical protein
LNDAIVIGIFGVAFLVSLMMIIIALGSRKVQRVFEKLSFQDFFVLPKDDNQLQEAMRVLQHDRFCISTEVERALYYRVGPHQIYVCDFWYTTLLSNSTSHTICTAIICPQQLPYDGYYLLRRSMPDALEDFFSHREPGKKIVGNWQKDFSSAFRVVQLEGKTPPTFSAHLQSTLFQWRNRFPLRQNKDRATHLHLNSRGWAIVCERVMQESLFYELRTLSMEIAEYGIAH